MVATWLSHGLTALPRVGAALLADPRARRARTRCCGRSSYGMFGTTPRDGSWEWMLVVAPHSSTPFDLAQTIGSACLVLGTCLLVVGALRGFWLRFVQVFFGAGAMTLTLYTLHVIMRTPDVCPTETPESYVWHVLVVLGDRRGVRRHASQGTARAAGRARVGRGDPGRARATSVRPDLPA